MKILRWWEKLELKMVDFQNHWRFTLRCLSQDLIPVSIKIKSTVKTPKGINIVRKAERMLMNERVRLINNMITMFRWQIDTCINSLGSLIGVEVMEECHGFISLRRERRHSSTLERQIKKYNLLWQRNTGGHSSFQHGGKTREESNKENGEERPIGTNSNPIEKTQDSSSSMGKEGYRKWVYNLSKTPLTEDQEKVLARGPNFAVIAKPPVSEYISQIEKACQQLDQGKAEELRGETKAILKNIRPPRPNISKKEEKAIQELRKDQSKIVLTTDKGVVMVVLEKEDYIRKSEDLLKKNTYRELTADPTNKYKNKLISLFKTTKSQGGINNTTYRRLYPTGAVSPKYYGLPKIHKPGVPLRPIISSRGSATYETAKELANIIKPLVGRSPHHVMNNKDFLENIKDIKLQPDECMISFDVSALFTSIPIDPAIDTIRKQLEEDQDLKERTSMTVDHIISLLEFCLKNTYFSFQGRYYEQTEGAAMGSPISPLVATIYMEEFEK